MSSKKWQMNNLDTVIRFIKYIWYGIQHSKSTLPTALSGAHIGGSACFWCEPQYRNKSLVALALGSVRHSSASASETEHRGCSVAVQLFLSLFVAHVHFLTSRDSCSRRQRCVIITYFASVSVITRRSHGTEQQCYSFRLLDLKAYNIPKQKYLLLNKLKLLFSAKVFETIS